MNMEETKHWIGFKKVLYACDFCGKDVVADCVIEVKDEASTHHGENRNGAGMENTKQR